jgi:nitrite reductase/ring-hydroxylating ferredoxin subunit
MADAPETKTPRWRLDFPIRWDQDQYVTRRELAKFLTLGSAVLVGATGAVATWGRRLAHHAHPTVRVCDAAAVPKGGSFLFRYPTEDDPCILLRLADGRLVAYSQVCTHLSCAVVRDPGTDNLRCPCHQGWFDGGDGRPFAGPPTRRLPRIRLEERDGAVYAVGVEV